MSDVKQVALRYRAIADEAIAMCKEQAAELTRLRAMLTPPDDVQCYTVDALKYNDGLDLPGDMPMVPADVVNRLRARIEAADRLAEALTFYANPSVYAPHPHGIAFERRDLSYHAVAALSAYEGEKG
jgi:hypothetical protein